MRHASMHAAPRPQVLETNRRVQAQNNAPEDFPAFVRQGYAIKVLADGYSVDSKGLIFKVRLVQRRCACAAAAMTSTLL